MEGSRDMVLSYLDSGRAADDERAPNSHASRCMAQVPAVSVKALLEILMPSKNPSMYFWALWAMSLVASQLIHFHTVMQEHSKHLFNRFVRCAQPQTRVFAADILLSLLSTRNCTPETTALPRCIARYQLTVVAHSYSDRRLSGKRPVPH